MKNMCIFNRNPEKNEILIFYKLKFKNKMNFIEKKMEEYVQDKKYPQSMRSAVFGWMSEINEQIFLDLLSIVSNNSNYKLIKYWNDDDKIEELDPSKIKEIQEIGRTIHSRGGMTALQANFYVLINFTNFKLRVKQIEHYWNGIGEWKH